MLASFHRWPGLANLVFFVVLILGGLAYLAMPRAQYPEVKLNWVAVATVWPGASSQDVDRRLTLPLETALRRVQDIRYISATSRDHVSTLLLRFDAISPAQFERRMQDLAREIQATTSEFPKDVRPPQMVELTTSSLLHTALILVTDPSGSADVCDLAASVKQELEAMPGVDRVWAHGERRPELEVRFEPEAVARHGVALESLIAAVSAHARDFPAGNVNLDGRSYAVRVEGLSGNPDFFGELQIPTKSGGHVSLSEVAEIRAGRTPAIEKVAYAGAPAVLMAVTKQENANTFELLGRIKTFIAQRNQQLGHSALVLADDQTEATRDGIAIMEYNALLGLAMVLFIAWLFMGRRIALLVSIGLPFALAAMFLVLYLGGETMNVAVLLGVAIVLGIPIDDAVVVAEAISLRLNQGVEKVRAVREALREVGRPVAASVLATTAAFAPLIFMPGILGEFMRVVPITVIVTLLASLLASLWILPTHVAASHLGHEIEGKWQGRRIRFSRWMRARYGRMLAASFRHPGRVAGVLILASVLVVASLAQGWLRTQWFLSDPLRVFNVNVRLPTSADLDTTLKATRAVEQQVQALVRPGEVHASYAIAGMQFTPSEPLTGEYLGQVTLSLAPEGRDVESLVAMLRGHLTLPPKVLSIDFQVISADLPSLSGISLRLVGANSDALKAAASEMQPLMASVRGLSDVHDDAQAGKPQITLRLDAKAASRAGLDPLHLAGYVRLHHDGVPVAKVVDGEQEIDVVIRAKPMDQSALQSWLEQPLELPSGQTIRPGELFTVSFEENAGALRRINHRRAVTLLASIDHEVLSSRAAIEHINRAWRGIEAKHEGVELVLGGEFDDVHESLDAIGTLFLLGLFLMYLMLALQFRSVSLPVLILATAPMAFAGAALGLLVAGMPVSLYSLYGGIALGGVAVNASIMLVSAARDRTDAGYAALSAAFHAARRRLAPILITSLSIIAGLVSVAAGFAGNSVLWGPLASTLVWGLAFAVPMTLFATPLLYYAMYRARGQGRSLR